MGTKASDVPDLSRAHTLGARVRALREYRGWVMEDFARRVGVAYSTLSAWELDKAGPAGKNLRKLSVALNVPPSVLLGEEGTVTEAQYEGWRRFLATPQGKGMTDAERHALGSMRFSAGYPVTAELYVSLLTAMRIATQS